MIPSERRLPQAEGLVEQLGYFVVHAPRQTGKTTALTGLVERLNTAGRHAAVLLSCEEGRAAGDDYAAAQRAILGDLRRSAARVLPPELQPPRFDLEGREGLLANALSAWAVACPRPLVLVFDEIDALRGASLLSVLSQLRAGFRGRPEHFPASVVLCGLRDVRDYKAASGGDPDRLGSSSPFNIKLESLRVGNFDDDEVRELFAQHQADTGQRLTDAGLERILDATAGQPWLVNALGRELTEKMAVPVQQPITPELVDQARERLVLARATHLDSLVARLEEPRVRRIIQPLLAGTLDGGGDAYDDDLQYCRDLGLVTPHNPIAISNSIYREVIVRVLASSIEARIPTEPRSFVGPDGRLDVSRILHEFADVWREHGDVLTSNHTWHETAPQLVLMAFLQRVVNGGGFIDREYGIGRGRIDLLVRWPYTDHEGVRALQREAIEIKVWRDRGDPRDKGLAQLDEYLTRLDLPRGVLVIFDRRSTGQDIADRTSFEEAVTPSGRPVTLLRA